MGWDPVKDAERAMQHAYEMAERALIGGPPPSMLEAMDESYRKRSEVRPRVVTDPVREAEDRLRRSVEYWQPAERAGPTASPSLLVTVEDLRIVLKALTDLRGERACRHRSVNGYRCEFSAGHNGLHSWEGHGPRWHPRDD